MLDFRETITALSPTVTVDGYGDTSWTWDNPTSLVVERCGIADGGSVEPNVDARAAVVSDFDVIAPAGTPVGPANRVIVPRDGGLVCEVVGRPFDWQLGAWSPGKVIRVKIAEG